MDVDCLLIILEYLDFKSLLNIAQTHKQFSLLAADIFRRKFSQMNIFIDGFSINDNLNALSSKSGIMSKALRLFGFKRKNSEVIIIDNQIRIEHFDLLSEILKHFGKVITNLKIRNDYFACYFESDVFKNYISLVNEYCSETLVHFSIDYCVKNTLEHMSKPFEQVESVSIGVYLNGIEDNVWPMNELFPQLKSLSLIQMKYLDGYYIDYHFPHLDHLYLYVDVAQDSEASQLIEVNTENLIRKNRMIRYIGLRNISPSFLQMINKQLSHLETLRLFEFNFHDVRIHFKNVTKFEMKDSYGSPDRFTFSKLKELHFNCKEELCNKWINFLSKNENISRLHIGYADINDEALKVLTTILPNLIEMSISFARGIFIYSNTILEFIENHNRLMRFDFEICSGYIEAFLMKELDDEWIITNYHRGLSLRRKN